MGNIAILLLEFLLWIIRGIFNIIGWIFKGIINLFSSEMKSREKTSNSKTLVEVKQRIEQALAANNEVLSLSENALKSVRSGDVNKDTLNEQCRYCKHLKSLLADANKDIQQDLSKLDNEGFVFRKEKYSHTLSAIQGIKYPISKEHLKELIKNHSGCNKFIAEVLEFAEVKGVKIGMNEWEYTKGNNCFNLSLDNNSEIIKVSAKSTDPIRQIPSTKPVNKPKDENALLNFDDRNELVVHLSRKVSEFDHYDVCEYFTSIDNWMAKKEINDYAGKKQLTVREAFDFEDNVPLLLENCRKVAPPPADYLPDHEKMHGGKQRWAQYKDIERAGMLQDKGFIIGKMGYGSLLYTGEYSSHILTIASVGSGKGVGVVIPNLLRHKGSVVVLDPKGENFLVTGNKRAKLGNKVFYYDPWEVIDDYAKLNRSGVSYNAVKAKINPLDLISENEIDIIDKAKMLASSLIIRESDSDSFFYNEAETFIARLIVYICTAYKKGHNNRNLIELRRLIMIDKTKLFNEILSYCQNNRDTYHSIVHELLQWLDSNIQSGARSLQSIYTFAQIGTSFLMSERVKESLSTSNIDILSLKTNPTSLYLILDMDKLLFTADNYKPLVRLIITTCMVGASVKSQPKEKLLFMLDEIAQLGNLQYLPNLMSIYRGKGVVVWTIWQSIAQIQENYPNNWQTVFDNCDVQQFFGVNNTETAKFVSEKAGQTTIYEESFNASTTHNTSHTDTETRGESYSQGTSYSEGRNSGYSYQGFNYTNSGGTSTGTTTTNNYTDSYNFSRAIQIGFSETSGKTLAKKAVPLITPFEVTTGNAYSIQFVFYMSKCPFPILSGKIKYFEDKAFYGEFDKNITLK
ncbi:MAG: type IV secretory system conjugative DNA transfer family protein [Dysgonamonadaceae bacterium]|jgi:type IV secretion system protein VirD4|nr:type IV secretory system conjugative DNA transfer family protein [Dysgonamonadaceae bacterium]